MLHRNQRTTHDLRYSMDWTLMEIDSTVGPSALPRLATAPAASTDRGPARAIRRDENDGTQGAEGLPSPTELEWSWGFRSEVLAVLAEDPRLLAGGELRTAQILLEEASRGADLTRATDYDIELRLPTTWALRVRRFSYLRRFGNEIVLRDSTRRGGPTEAEKVLTHSDGPDRYLYAWVSEDESRFVQWLVLDVPRLRRIWSDPDRRLDLNTHPVRFDGERQGLAFPIDALIATRVVIRAVLAKPSFTTLAQAEAFLADCHALRSYTHQERRGVAIFLLKHATDSHYYVGPDPL